MGTRRNNPVNAQQPAPLFANDPNGFWNSVARQNSTSGLGAILPHGTLNQADTAIAARQLTAQIGWRAVNIRWKGCHLKASLSDAQFFLALEQGGDTQQGRITLVINKFEFQTGFPQYNDTIDLQASGKWHEFVVAEMLGHHDDNEPALTLFLEKDQNELGE